MTHSHDGDRSAFYVEQLCTIGICGALGGVAIMLWSRNLLQLILVPKFHIPVLLGGIALLVLVTVRAVTVWFAVEQPNAAPDQDHCHDHDHDHGAPNHEHASEDPHHHGHHHAHALGSAAEPHHHDHGHIHGHDHGHAHGGAPWRYAVLLLPIVLYLLNLPNEALSGYHGQTVDAANVAPVNLSGGEKGFINATFLELDRAASSPSGREYYEGRVVRLKGRFKASPTSTKRFTLFRDKMNCCAADVIRINLVAESPTDLMVRELEGQWVEVTGKVAFAKVHNKDQYITVLVMRTPDDLKQVPPDLNPYIY
jgi:hypothetical protein